MTVIFMSTTYSPATVKAWNWVIQSLAKFKQLDASTLAGLVKKAPAISDVLGKDEREMVSLRILENLFIQENEPLVDTDSAQNSKISFDLSEHSEDVLNKILKETSEPMTELERKKWNVRPFILHKRASFPKSPLQKFKEALLNNSHPILESLKEMSNLEGANVSENTNTIPEVDVDLNAQPTIPKDNFVSRNTENESNKLQESQLPKSDHVENYTSGIIEHIGINEHEMNIEPPIKGLEENTLMDHIEHSVSRNHVHSIDTDRDKLPYVSRSGPSGEGKSSMKNVSQMEMGTDSDKSDDERTDIAAKKEAFLSSQGTLSQDFLATIDRTEICLCMKCNKDGELLICSSDTCPIRVHVSCLASTANFDEHGNYFCPFCAYSRAISKYLEVKKKTSIARKDLEAFLRSGSKHRPKGACVDKNKSRETGVAGENIEVNDGTHTTNRGREAEPIDSFRQPKCLLKRSSPKQKYNEKESLVSSISVSVSGHSKRPRKSEPQYTSPTIPLARRKIFLWTKLEEETLKEGVGRFPSVDNKGIPWKLILDFGRDVFDKSRTTVDLKDKWRNICKGIPENKKRNYRT